MTDRSALAAGNLVMRANCSLAVITDRCRRGTNVSSCTYDLSRSCLLNGLGFGCKGFVTRRSFLGDLCSFFLGVAGIVYAAAAIVIFPRVAFLLSALELLAI